jgi:hypothetical protein
MKNFPHQINQLEKLFPSLRIFADLEAQGQSLADDGIVGEALARAGVYAFREKDMALEDRLAMERAKSTSSQGMRTYARDLRRFFSLMDFLQRTDDGEFEVTAKAEALLATDNAAERNRQFREALMDLALQEDEFVSHPYRLLLRLVETRPGLPVEFLGLALEAEDDSEQEFERLLELIDDHEWIDVCQIIEVSVHQGRNSIKILPALARQLGDIYEEDGKYYRAGTTVTATAAPAQPTPRARPRPRHVTAGEIASQGVTERERDDPREVIPQDPEAIRAAIEIRQIRTGRHNGIVRELAELLEQAGCVLLEFPFDCLGIGDTLSVLAEVKTLDGSTEDEILQVQDCLAQLLYYERFDIPVAVNRTTLKKVAVFESRISTEHQAFLEEHDCVVLWKENNVLAGTARGLALLSSLGLI